MTTAAAELENDEAGTEQSAPTRPSYDDINTPVVVMVGAISAILTVCTIFFVQGVYYQWKNSYVRERSYDYVNEPVREIVNEQKALLGGSAEKGIKSVEETMADVVKKYGQ